MDTDAVLSALKLTGATIGGALGVAGLLVDFKLPSGRLSKVGYFVLAGILVSALVGVGDAILEGYKAKSDSVEQISRNNELLNRIDRVIQPISTLEAFYWFECASDDEIAVKYFDRVKRGIDARSNELRKFPPPVGAGLAAIVSGAHGEPLQVKINKNSDLYPHGDEKFISEALTFATFSIFISKKLKPPFSPVHGTADFDAFDLFTTQADLVWDTRKQKLYIQASMKFDKKLWNSSGEIISVVDLKGAQIEIVPNVQGGLQVGPDFRLRKSKSPLARFMEALVPSTIGLTVSEGRTLWLHEKDFHKAVLSDTDTSVYFMTLPSDDASFRKQTASGDDN